MNISSKTAVLVVSYDSFSDMWDLFFTCLKKFWADCAFEKYLLTNYQDYHNECGVNVLKVGALP